MDPWSRGRELAGDVVRYPSKTERCIFWPFETDGEVFSSALCTTEANIFFCRTPGQLPPHDTGHGVKTVTLGWVGAPNERTPFIFHDAVVGLKERCLLTTRNFAASNQTSAWVFLKPILAQHQPQNLHFRAFQKVWNFPSEEKCSWQAVPETF